MKHVCIICGYVYDDALPFAELPEDYECPICGVGKSKFEVITHNHKEPFLKINYGLYVITSKDNDKDNGCVIDALMQLTDNPPVVAFSINKTNKTHEVLMNSKEFNISILTEDAPKELFRIFSAKSGKDINKFEEFTDAKRSANGIYYLTKYVNTRLSGKIVDAIDAGTHTLFRGEITDSEIFNNKDTLTYSDYRKEMKYKQMFCYQCQQTAKGTGCTMVGVCGKKEDTANEQDKLTCELIGLAVAAKSKNDYSKEIVDMLADGMFTVLTNVNFDTNIISEQTKKAKAKREALGGELPITPDKLFNGETDLISIRSTLIFGLRGMAAYTHHSRVLGKRSDEVDNWFIDGTAELAKEHGAEKWLDLIMEFGQINLKCMALLDEANTGTYGTPVPTTVPLMVEKGPFIIITGHDLHDLKMLLEQTDGKGVNVYTHGEMLPAHAYPELKKHAQLKGNFGTAWQSQQNEFDSVPAPILFTTNCLMSPKKSYTDRVYTTSVVGFPDLIHIEADKNGYKDFSAIIEQAKTLGGYGKIRSVPESTAEQLSQPDSAEKPCLIMPEPSLMQSNQAQSSISSSWRL